MKNEDKIISDSPKRLWVKTFSLLHKTGLMSIGNVSYREYWIGHKNKVPKHCAPYCFEKEEEYVSLRQSWHKAKEVPEDLHTIIVGVSKNFTHPVLIDLEKKYLHKFYDAFNISGETIWNQIIRKEFRFAYWAYIKDLVPTIEEGGTR